MPMLLVIAGYVIPTTIEIVVAQVVIESLQMHIHLTLRMIFIATQLPIKKVEIVVLRKSLFLPMPM